MDHEKYMARCLQLAVQGCGMTAPNPMVGAVLVHQNEIIGEGFHRQFGGPHAEVECIRSVPEGKRELISESTLYVSLEPCNHFGKTPPCTELILEYQIPKVVIGCIDRSPGVNGEGLRRLSEAGVEVIAGVMEREAQFLNRRFFTFHERQRPYVILKWAQTAGGVMGVTGERLKISNAITDRKVHQWRSEESAILVGTKTALLDNPHLTTRLWPGNNPIRIVIDRELVLPGSLHLFDSQAPVWIFNRKREGDEGHVKYIHCGTEDNLTPFILTELHKRNILSLLVEGGAFTLQSFLDSGLWDEARLIVNRELDLSEGLHAPAWERLTPWLTESFRTDSLYYYMNPLL